jgi:hypothetical protein
VTRPPEDVISVEVRPSFLAHQLPPASVPLPGEEWLPALASIARAAWVRWRDWLTRDRPAPDEMSRSWRLDRMRRGW